MTLEERIMARARVLGDIVDAVANLRHAHKRGEPLATSRYLALVTKISNLGAITRTPV